MLKHNEYDKAKLLHKLSCLIWFIENHAHEDAKKADDKEFAKILEHLKKDLNKYIPQLRDSFCK